MVNPENSSQAKINKNGKEAIPPTLKIEAEENVTVSAGEEIILKSLEEEKVIGIRRTKGDCFSSATDKNPDGSIRQRLRGHPPQGEDDSLEAAKIFIQYLNREGGTFAEPQRAEELDSVIDFTAQDKKNSKNCIKMQVTRPPDTKIYKDWAHLGPKKDLEIKRTVEELADKLNKAIANKRLQDSSDIYLLLDCTKIMDYSMPEVSKTSREKFGQEINGTKFKQIWIIGPEPTSCIRLK